LAAIASGVMNVAVTRASSRVVYTWNALTTAIGRRLQKQRDWYSV